MLSHHPWNCGQSPLGSASGSERERNAPFVAGEYHLTKDTKLSRHFVAGGALDSQTTDTQWLAHLTHGGDIKPDIQAGMAHQFLT